MHTHMHFLSVTLARALSLSLLCEGTAKMKPEQEPSLRNRIGQQFDHKYSGLCEKKFLLFKLPSLWYSIMAA